MSEDVKEMLDLVNMLPETEQNLISEMIKRIILAWDPDFTKLTANERQRMEQADKELKNGEYATHEAVWAEIE